MVEELTSSRKTRFFYYAILVAVLAVIVGLPTVFAGQSFGTNLGEFNGVASFSNGSSTFYSGSSNYVGGIYTGIRWQCVEYVRRFYVSVYGVDLGSKYRGNANTWYEN